MQHADTTLHPHPRLYLGNEQIARLKTRPRLPLLRRAAAILDRDARQFVRSAKFKWERNTHNAHLLRARTQQVRVISLLAQWIRTGKSSYRNAVIAHLQAMAEWDYWSWISWRKNESAPDSIYDLSYGENAATLALAWDLLYETLSESEKALIVGLAKKWVASAFLKHTEPGKETWWYKYDTSNWLAVCAGGAGLLALAMHDEIPEAAEMLKRADSCVTRFMESLKTTGGGWSEGVVYWNYGMRYAFMYLLSHERATGAPHPAIELPETAGTLRYPLDFAPQGMTCGFGDMGDATWRPIALHYAMAERLHASDVLESLDAQPHDAIENVWATVPELLALHPGVEPPRVEVRQEAAVKLYPGLGWGLLADQMPNPRVYAAIRGGSTAMSHNSSDLMSWHCLIDGERVVWSPTNHEYIDTTFSNRRFDLPELRADSKNTILVGGVGIAQPGTSDTSLVTIDTHPAIRIDATEAYRVNGSEGPMVKFAGRLFLLINKLHLLIVDRVEMPHTNRIETRFHTNSTLKVGKDGAMIKAGKSKVAVAFAASVPCRVTSSLFTPTDVRETPANVLRWASEGLHASATLVTLLTPQRKAIAASVRVSETTDNIVLTLKLAGKTKRLVMGRHLD